eukprot:3314657-Alexandrium_andersonii.AAC.1
MASRKQLDKVVVQRIARDGLRSCKNCLRHSTTEHRCIELAPGPDSKKKGRNVLDETTYVLNT